MGCVTRHAAAPAGLPLHTAQAKHYRTRAGLGHKLQRFALAIAGSSCVQQMRHTTTTHICHNSRCHLLEPLLLNASRCHGGSSHSPATSNNMLAYRIGGNGNTS
jgi:hypothetical protein